MSQVNIIRVPADGDYRHFRPAHEFPLFAQINGTMSNLKVDPPPLPRPHPSCSAFVCLNLTQPSQQVSIVYMKLSCRSTYILTSSQYRMQHL